MRKSLLITLMLAVFLDIANFFLPVPIYTPLFLHTTFLSHYSYEAKSILLGLLVACYGLAQLFGGPIYGEISDQFGRKKAIVFSMCTAIIGCLLGGVSLYFESLPLIFLSRLIIGFSSGTVAVVFASTADNSSEKDLAKNMGYINTGLSVGATVGPIIGGHLVSSHIVSITAYAIPFFATSILFMINLCLILKFLPWDQPKREGDKKIHLLTPFQNIGIAMKESKYMCMIVLSALFFQISTESFFLAAPIIGASKFHLNSPQISNYFFLFGIVSAASSWWINAFITKNFKNSRKIYLTCEILYAITISSLMLVNSKLTFMIPFICVGIFAVLSWVQVNNLFSEAVDKTKQGLIFGVSQSMWSMGGIIGTTLVGISSSVHQKVTAALPFSFMMMSLIFAVLVVFLYRKTKINQVEK